jgi:ABC-type nitrate/sulfonate/bicarbonate transport system substrate-binding protein
MPNFFDRPMWRGFLAAVVLCASAMVARADDPVKIRLGFSTSAEEQLWLLMAKTDIGVGYGKAYTLDATRFTNSAERSQAFAANAIDIASSSATGVLFAAAEGIPSKIIASISRESQQGDFSTSFFVLADSPIKTIADMQGKTIGINGFSTSGELWTRAAFERNGLQTKDIRFAPISFSAMAEALRSGKIEVGEFPQPFASMVEHDMKTRRIFTAKDGAPFDEELIVLVSGDEFLKKNVVAVKAFLADLQAATKFYLTRTREARQILIDKKFVRVPADVYLDMKDYYREPSMRIDPESLKKMQELQLKAGFQKKAADIGSLVDLTYLPPTP